MRIAATSVLFAATLTGMVLLRECALDPSGEQQREKIHTQLADLPAKDMVPAYIGSLFLGSFRALAIDVFWIRLKEAQEARRLYQAREIMEMISKLQPHNEEVWSMLAWDSAYNIANSEQQISRDRAWKWIRYGILKLREGGRVNPRSPYLSFELARMLQHKPSWRTGELDMDFLSRIEGDDEIQAGLQLSGRDGTKTAFELSLLWFEETIRRLDLHPESQNFIFRTQMGLYLHKEMMEGYIRDTMYLQAIHRWREAREAGPDSPAWGEAREWLDRAGKQAEKISREFTFGSVSGELATFYRDLGMVFGASHAFHRNRNADTLRVYVSEMEKLLIRFGPIDGGFVRNVLSEARRNLSREEYGRFRGAFLDRNEFNDTHPFATPLEPGHPLHGNLLPLHDVDSFSIRVPAPGRPILRVTRIGGTDLEIRISLGNAPPLLARTIRDAAPVEIPFEASTPGFYHVDIRPAAAHTSDTRYRIEVGKVPADDHDQ